jgi:predicted transcriptional regulator YdeE
MGGKMQPKIITLESFEVMGTESRITPEEESSETYGLVWKAFELHLDTIRPHSTDHAYYGVNFPTKDEGVFDYVAGMAVGGAVTPPEGLVIRRIPAARYAVFECSMIKIGETYQHIFSTWLPGSPYRPSGSTPVFEQYAPEGENPLVRIHVPVEEKTAGNPSARGESQ